MENSQIKRAIISVTDKSGIVEFAQKLIDEFGVEIISTGGTAKVLQEAGLSVTMIEDFTGFPEMMDGRIKTLHPKVHGALLARRRSQAHMQQAAEHDISLIDLVVVNLYAFEQTVAKENVDFADAIEHIDIGGPAMLRSAAKNHESVTVVTNPADYSLVLAEMRKNNGATTLATRKRLALEVFRKTSAYDNAIYQWLENELAKELPADGAAGDTVQNEDATVGASQNEETAQNASQFNGEHPSTNAAAFSNATAFSKDKRLFLQREQVLRYGENPHQKAAFYKLTATGKCAGLNEFSLANAQQVQGEKELSYNNYLDADAAWASVREFDFDTPTCVIIKHLTPCGIAQAKNQVDAYQRAFECDSVSAFGGVMAFNSIVEEKTARQIVEENKQFIEVVIAPDYEAGALEIFKQKKNARILKTGGINKPGHTQDVRSIEGGIVVQDSDAVLENESTFSVPTKTQPTKEQMDELLFAWKAAKCVKSNAVVLTKNHATVGIGGGQPNRVNSARIAVEQAGKKAQGAVVGSDAFLPFPDTLEVVRDAGCIALIQPGGSIRDELSIECADAAKIPMVFTGHRHFRHQFLGNIMSKNVIDQKQNAGEHPSCAADNAPDKQPACAADKNAGEHPVDIASNAKVIGHLPQITEKEWREKNLPAQKLTLRWGYRNGMLQLFNRRVRSLSGYTIGPAISAWITERLGFEIANKFSKKPDGVLEITIDPAGDGQMAMIVEDVREPFVLTRDMLYDMFQEQKVTFYNGEHDGRDQACLWAVLKDGSVLHFSPSPSAIEKFTADLLETFRVKVNDIETGQPFNTEELMERSEAFFATSDEFGLIICQDDNDHELLQKLQACFDKLWAQKP